MRIGEQSVDVDGVNAECPRHDRPPPRTVDQITCAMLPSPVVRGQRQSPIEGPVREGCTGFEAAPLEQGRAGGNRVRPQGLIEGQPVDA